MNTTTEKQNLQSSTDVRERPFVSPDVNIYETADAFILQAEMPGVRKDGLEVILESNTLTFLGNREDEAVAGTMLYRESCPTNFRRSFELDPAIDVEKISAEMQQGVLTLTLPKTPRVKSRKIQIK
jgi:HSP20 family protein